MVEPEDLTPNTPQSATQPSDDGSHLPPQSELESDPVQPEPEDKIQQSEPEKDAPQQKTPSSDLKVENTGAVNNMINAGNIFGDIYFSAQDREDPTLEFPTAFYGGKPYHSPQEVTDFAGKLLRERLLLLFCTASEAADSAVSSILASPEFAGYAQRHLVRQRFDAVDFYKQSEKGRKGVEQPSAASAKTTSNGVLSLDDLLSRKINNGLPAIVVAEPDSRPFIESIFGCRPSDVAQYRQIMERRNLFLLVKVDNPGLIRYIQNNLGRLRYPYWLVSRLRYLLRQHFDASEVQEYEAGLEAQRAKDLWGENANEDALTNAVQLELSKGKSYFAREYYRKLEILEKPPAEIVRLTEEEESRRLQPSEFLSKKDDPIAFHLAFLGAWFEKMTVREFDNLAFYFFSDQDKQVEVGKTSKRIRHDDGSVETVETPDRRSFLSIWREDPDECRRRAHLRRVLPPGSPFHYVEFDEFYLRDAVRDYFENRYPSFAGDSFDFLFSYAFFSMDASKNVLDNLARLNARMARSEPAAALARLTGISFNIHRAEEQSDAKAAERVRKAEDIGMKLMEMFSIMQEKAELQEYKYEYFKRIHLLVVEFWNDPQLAETVQQFFNWLLNNRFFEPVHFLVQRMWNAGDFKPLFWIQQLLERGDSDAKSATYRLLLHAAQQELARSLWEYMDEIASWLPDREMPSGNYSRSNEHALAFLFHYVASTSGEAKNASAKESPLLSPMFSDTDNGAARWEKLLNWLLHPGMAVALHRIEERDVFRIPGPARAYVLDNWFWQLHGSEEPIPAEVEAIVIEMIATFGRVTTLREYRDTLSYLRIRSENYRENRSDRERNRSLRHFIQLYIEKNPFTVA